MIIWVLPLFFIIFFFLLPLHLGLNIKFCFEGILGNKESAFCLMLKESPSFFCSCISSRTNSLFIARNLRFRRVEIISLNLTYFASPPIKALNSIL